MAWRKIEIDGVFVKGSKSGKTIKVSLADFEKNLDELKKALLKHPTWKNDFKDNEREVYFTFGGGIGEVWGDDEDVPPDYGAERKKKEPEGDEPVPF